MKLISFKEAIELAKTKEIIEEKEEHRNFDKKYDVTCTVIHFTDGSKLIAKSDYEEDYSEHTPGQGLLIPDFYYEEPNVKLHT